MVIMLINVEKGKSTMLKTKIEEEPIDLLTYKGESEEKNTWYLGIKADNHMCGFKICL